VLHLVGQGAGDEVSTMSQQGLELPAEMTEAAVPMTAAEPEGRGAPVRRPVRGRGRAVASLVCLPIAALVALGVHLGLPDRGPVTGTRTYPWLLATIAIAGVLAGIGQAVSAGLRRWYVDKAPLLAGLVMTLCAWDLVTAKWALLPTMYFPGPQRVLQTLIDDRRQLFDSTWHSLGLLFAGYAVGVAAGLISGIMIGWSRHARYWGMPFLKVVGPIPATAWIPMALIFFPQSMAAGIFLIALAVWFPVTMLTASGVSNVRASYLDVARTLGAGRWFLIFRVAIPAAMPSIFVGLFMGLGASFLTLLVAESTGVSSGLGWYIDWARNYSDYTKVFAALAIMAAFFSTIMTLLFLVRDHVLVWQTGTIKG
jgi:NitT/TauT family transport system permease protein